MWMLALIAAMAHAGSARVLVIDGSEGPRVTRVVATSPLDVAAQPGPLKVVDADGSVLATAALPDARHRSVVTPEGGQVTRVDRAAVLVDVPWPDHAFAIELADSRVTERPEPTAPPTSAPIAIALQQTGSPDERLDMVFLGDGYTEAQQADFADDVDWIVDYLLSIEPYGAYTGLFNIWRVDLISNETGVDHPELGTEADSALGCSYDCQGIQRLICCDDEAVMEAVAATVPSAEGVMVLINDDDYGGAGGFAYATAYVGRDSGMRVAAHELGHSLIGLWDEYGYGVPGPTDQEGPNCSLDPEGGWPDWVGSEAVDSYQECSYIDHYRPTENQCMMRTLADDYCPVCRELAVKAIYERLPELIVATDPPPGTTRFASDTGLTFSAEVLGPDSGLEVRWTVDGQLISTELSWDATGTGLVGEVMLEVSDPTPWVRSDPDERLRDAAGPWTLAPEPQEPETPRACGCDMASGATGPWWVALGLLLWRRRN